MSTATSLRHRLDGVRTNGHRSRNRRGRSWAQRMNRRKQCVVVRVEGELDAAAFPEFHAVLDHALHTARETVVVDLRAVRFMSIRAATTLGQLKQRAAGEGLDLRIVAGRQEVERALEVAGVRPLFCYYASMRTALDR